MRFQRDESFDEKFDGIGDELKWYPYVGKNFGQSGTRIMVFAHNIPIHPNDIEVQRENWKARDSLSKAETIEEFTYEHGSGRGYTRSFRNFIKGSVGLTKEYTKDSDAETIAKIDAFIRRISYINFIHDLVISTAQITLAQSEQIESSKRINLEILRILGITHCICWGKPTYHYVRSLDGYKVLPDENHLEKRGFSSCTIDVGGGQTMQCLRTYHPSMPRFGALQKSTHDIISRFLST